jgi:hypothetical protein
MELVMYQHPYAASGRNYKLKDLRKMSIDELNQRYFELLKMAEHEGQTIDGRYNHTNKVMLAEKYKRVMQEKGCLPNIGGAISVVEFKQEEEYIEILSYKVVVGKIRAIDLYTLYLKDKEDRR